VDPRDIPGCHIEELARDLHSHGAGLIPALNRRWSECGDGNVRKRDARCFLPHVSLLKRAVERSDDFLPVTYHWTAERHGGDQYDTGDPELR
jgi:hypothetical protein